MLTLVVTLWKSLLMPAHQFQTHHSLSLCHPGPTNESGSSRTVDRKHFLCPVCLEVLQNPVILGCAHRFCYSCINEGLPIPLGTYASWLICIARSDAYSYVDRSPEIDLEFRKCVFWESSGAVEEKRPPNGNLSPEVRQKVIQW